MTPNQIKRLRRRLKLTQRQLADEIGVDPRTVMRWENGDCEPQGAGKKNLEKLQTTES
ncbi:hypothetical protein LCGC14_3092330 [marine sediment metagenome]|uniref:HTH cro/C1-type domain-containing protein n=1 Tax=marine sediment metagenome TaxID=412755 RepID=A0A0F8WA48_9ZZZZ